VCLDFQHPRFSCGSPKARCRGIRGSWSKRIPPGPTNQLAPVCCKLLLEASRLCQGWTARRQMLDIALTSNKNGHQFLWGENRNIGTLEPFRISRNDPIDFRILRCSKQHGILEISEVCSECVLENRPGH